MSFKNYNQYIKYLQEWILATVKSAKKDGVIFGISGGIDSACCLAICNQIKAIKTHIYFLDIASNKEDKDYVNLLAKKFNISIPTINLTKSWKVLAKTLKIKNQDSLNNIKPRLRMTTLYALAQQHNLLVLGTSNADEMYTGYFTKYGDGGSDLAPIANLTKSDIKAISKILNVPQEIIDRTPSAGLYQNQKDEDELKVTYDEIDKFLLNQKINPKSKQRIMQLHKSSLHKYKISNKPLPYKKILAN